MKIAITIWAALIGLSVIALVVGVVLLILGGGEPNDWWPAHFLGAGFIGLITCVTVFALALLVALAAIFWEK